MIIHRLLELMSGEPRPHPEEILATVAATFQLSPDDPKLKAWQGEAMNLLNDAELAPLFDPTHYLRAWNEVPLAYQSPAGIVHGIVDRLVLRENEVLVVDYKSHGHARRENLAELAAPYRRQLDLYGEGARRLWPDRRVRKLLLFTACGGIHEFTG